MELNDALQTTAELTVEVPGGEIKVEYRVNAFTPALVESDGGIAEALEVVLVSSDLTKDGEPVPLTSEGLKLVPFVIQRAIWRAIGGDHSPNLTGSSTIKPGV